MKSFLNSPIGHTIAAALAIIIGYWISAGEPGGTITIGAILKGLYSWAVSPIGTTAIAGRV